jgi:hypothetical protein
MKLVEPGLRCHDEGLGLLPHQAYLEILKTMQHESGPLNSIGIVTQSFVKARVRSFDAQDATLAKSRLVAYDLAEHLRTTFPQAEVTLFNGASEIPLRSYARLVKARKVAICGPSTFCTYPVLATQGVGYLFQGHTNHSPRVQHVQLNNIRTFVVPRLANHFAGQLINYCTGYDIKGHWQRFW